MISVCKYKTGQMLENSFMKLFIVQVDERYVRCLIMPCKYLKYNPNKKYICEEFSRYSRFNYEG